MSGDGVVQTSADATSRALVVGGHPDVQLAWCRLFGPSGDVSLLRWDRRLSGADASRFCRRSYWLGRIGDELPEWKARLLDLIRSARITELIPADSLAHAVLCDGGLSVPEGVRTLGPTRDVHALGTDRLHAFAAARACGWRVLDWSHIVSPHDPSATSLPCVVRPRRDALIIADEPALFSSRVVTSAEALDAKLRDDVPRGEVVIQPVAASVRRLCVVVRHGTLVGLWDTGAARRATSEIADVTRRFVAALGWNGVLELEYLPGDGPPTLIDMRPGGGAAFVDAVRHRQTLGLACHPPTPSTDPSPVIVAPVLSVGQSAAKLGFRLRAAMWPRLGGSSHVPRLSLTSRTLLVCKGNINRSVVAEHVLKGAGYSRVASAGLLGMTGRRPSPAAESFIRDELKMPTDHVRSQSVRRALDRCGHVDLVLCFERREAVELGDRYPDLRNRIHLVTTLDTEQRTTEIGDPHGRAAADYRRCFSQIRSVLQRAVANAQ